MILIADSGATKTDWCVIGCGGEAIRFRTAGINAAVMPDGDVRKVVASATELLDAALRQNQDSGTLKNEAGASVKDVMELHFYGAGLVGDGTVTRLAKILKKNFRNAEIEADTDLMGAAKALWGDRAGAVAILGTGSNSCLYDGKRIVRNVRPGGFVLGDEGGGAALGKRLLGDFVKGLMPEEMMTKLQDKGLDYSTVVKNVYNSSNPAAYLASFAPFVFENMDSPYMEGIVADNFRLFVRRSLRQYAGPVADDIPGLPDGPLKVGVVGSLGCAGKEILRRVARDEGVEIVKFLQSPMNGLIDYYNDRNEQ